MLFRCQVVGRNEVDRCWLVRVSITPFLEQGMVQNMLTCAVASHHSEVVHRLDTRTDAREEAGSAGRSLRQQYGVADALLLDLLLRGLRQPLDEVTLHVLFTLEVG